MPFRPVLQRLGSKKGYSLLAAVELYTSRAATLLYRDRDTQPCGIQFFAEADANHQKLCAAKLYLLSVLWQSGR